jgi:methylmalonyl-CoA mutase N-terminal domain/subunit
MTINATASILLAFYARVAEENGAEISGLRGTVQNDVLKEYVARGNYIYPAEGALRLTTDMFEWCSKEMPKWNPISISGYHIREAGSTAVQELAFTFANAITYVESAVKRGLSVDAFAGQLALSSVLGGTQSLHTNALDEALALPTEESARLALRTQQIIASETGVTQSVDPLAGSYFIENLTAELEARCWHYLEEIDRLGGTVKCIEDGWIQNEILNSAYRDQRAIDEGRIRVVGVNSYQESAKGAPMEILRIPPELETCARERVGAWRRKRNQSETDRALRALDAGAKGNGNLMALVMECARAGATLGEISDALRAVFGQYQEYSGF